MASYRILTPEQVAKIMQVGLKTVYRWISAGKLDASQVGYKTYRIFEQDLILFMRKAKISKKR